MQKPILAGSSYHAVVMDFGSCQEAHIEVQNRTGCSGRSRGKLPACACFDGLHQATRPLNSTSEDLEQGIVSATRVHDSNMHFSDINRVHAAELKHPASVLCHICAISCNSLVFSASLVCCCRRTVQPHTKRQSCLTFHRNVP